MPRDVSATAQTQADLSNVFYTELYTVAVTGSSPVYLAPMLPVSGTIALSFGGNLYNSFPITRSPVRSTADTEVDGVSVKFQNVDQVFGALLETNDLRGSTVTISGVFLASGTNAPITQDPDDLIPIFDGTIGTMEVTEDNVQMQLNFAIKDIRVDVPRRFYGPGDGFHFVPITSI